MAETERFELRVRMDATVTVYDPTGQPDAWLKPGTETAHTWRGMPTVQEVQLRYTDMVEIAKITLEDLIVATRQRLDEARRKG